MGRRTGLRPATSGTAAIVAGAAAFALALALAGCGAVSTNTSRTGTTGIHVVDTSQAFPSEMPSSPAPTPSQSSAKVAGTAKSSPKPSVTRVPDKPLQCPKQPTTTGKPQSAKTVLSELKEIAGVNEYVVAKVDPLSLDTHLNGKLPDVSIPLAMLKAVAAEESSWTSNCVSGDGQDSYGIMQLDAATTDFINTKFGTGLSRTIPLQNVKLGNAYLEWLTVHFGILYFDNDFDLTTNTQLRTLVLAAYNTGVGTVDPSGNGSAPYVIGPIGQQYADTIVALMAPSQPCQKTWGH